jgi:quinolinate synthase
MKLNTLEKIYNCLKYESPEIILSDDLLNKAKKPIIEMLRLSKQLGL